MTTADDDVHAPVHWELANWYWDEQLGHRIVDAELDFFLGFVGVDLHVHRNSHASSAVRFRASRRPQ